MEKESFSFADVVTKMTLTGIECRQLEVKRESNGPADAAKLDYTFGFGLQENQIVFEVKQELIIFAAEQSPFVNFSMTYVAVYILPEAERMVLGNDELQQLLTRFAHMAIHPYLRASTTELANQVGIPGVVLGFLRQGAPLPESLAVPGKLFSFNASDIKSEN